MIVQNGTSNLLLSKKTAPKIYMLPYFLIIKKN